MKNNYYILVCFVFATLCMSACTSAGSTPDVNLVAGWKFENNLNDEAGVHNGNFFNSPVFVGGICGSSYSRAVQFVSSNYQAIAVSDLTNQLSPHSFTITAWVNVYPGAVDTYRTVISHRDTATRSGYVLYATNANKWAFWTGASDKWHKLNGPNVVENTTFFIAASFEATGTSGSDLIGDRKLYINGILAAEDTQARYVPVASGYDLLIGTGCNETTSHDYFFNGIIDDTRIYNYALNENEIAELYADNFGYFQGDLTGDNKVNLFDLASMGLEWCERYDVFDLNILVDNWLSEAVPTSLRIMSYNIHHGEGLDGILNLERIAQVIENSDADIIGLNEVDKNWGARSDYVDQAAWLAQRLNVYCYFGVTINDDPHFYGNAILSRYPILCSVNSVLPIGDDEENRACIMSKINISGKSYTFFVTHLGFIDETQIMQAEAVLNISNYADGNKIILGDMNFLVNDTPFVCFQQSFNDTFEAAQIVGYNPTGRIDYIFTSSIFNGSVDFTEVVATYPAVIASDHKPVVADITIQP